MTIFSLIKKDHSEAKKLLREINKTDETASQDRRRLFRNLRMALTAHTRAEEDVVYPVLEESDDYKGRLLAYGNEAEHEILEELMQKLGDMQVTDERWTSTLRVLKEIWEKHVQDEESIMFGRMRKDLSEDDLDRMAEDFSREREQYLSGFDFERQLPSEEERFGVLQ